MHANGWRGATRLGRCAPRWPTQLRPGRRIWSTGTSMPQHPVCCTWPTSPTCHWPAAGSAIPRWSSTPTPGVIPGWECSTSKHTGFVEAAIRQTVAHRRRQGRSLGQGTIHHSDAGSQYTAVHFGQTSFLEGLTPSIGSVGDAYDNALAETTIGLYKTECVRADSPFRRGPIRTLANLEEITSAWVHWYNTRRLMPRLDRIPPAEAEATYYAATDAATPTASHTN
jgi:putative transposase